MKKCVKQLKDSNKEQAHLQKVALIVKQNTGVGFHRLIQPAAWLEKNGMAMKVMTTRFSGDNKTFRIGKPRLFKGTENLPIFDDETLAPICKDADIIWTTAIYDLDEIFKILDLREWSGAKWVVDMDDNIYAVSNDNPAQDSARRLAKNLETCFQLADGVTVSVPMLRDLYAPFNKNIFVQKNALNFSYWKEQPRRKHKGIRIGWEGAYGHKADVEMVYPIIERLRKDYPEKNIQFVVFGVDFGLKCEYHDWVSLQDYPAKLAELDLDIAIAPLVDSNYNRCKSNLRLLEMSALKYPVVASPTENQRDLPVLYASNNYEWYENLEKLILDRKLRQDIGQKQYDFVKKNFNMRTNVQELANWFYDLPRRTDIAPNKVPTIK